MAVTNDIATQLTLYSDTANLAVLPVTLLSFSAQKQVTATLLQWQTTNEINNNYFNVERSSDSKAFYSIGRIDALQTSPVNNYSFTDKAPLNSMNFYRLKQTDNDGKFMYSGIVAVDFSSIAATFAVYPNPSTNTLNVTLPSINKTSYILLYDATGKEVRHEQLASNVTAKQINISKLSQGIYSVVLIQDGRQQTIKLVKK